MYKRSWGCITNNKDKDDDKEAIQWYYFATFNEDYTELYYMWRVEKTDFIVGMYSGEFNIENMKEYDITDKCQLCPQADIEKAWE